jgi:hypothetical protein
MRVAAMTAEWITDALEAEAEDRRNGITSYPTRFDGAVESASDDAPQPDGSWLLGSPMSPGTEPVESLPAIPGFPFLHPGAGAVIPGPTGSGRSFLMQTCCYDAGKLGTRCAYLGSEITEGEFNARAADIAERRGDTINDPLLEQLSIVRYLNLASTITAAMVNPTNWVDGIVERYEVVVIDPLSAVASALDMDFDRSNTEFIRFYDTLIAPLTNRGVTVALPDNIGHAIEAKGRAKGASAKSDRADLTFPCSKAPHGLVIKAQKVRTIRAGFKTGDQWLFDRDTLQIRPQHASETSSEPDGGFRPTGIMQRVSELVARQPGIGKKDIRQGVSGRNNYIDDAIAALTGEGYIDVQSDARGGHHHHPIRPFIADSDEGPCPDRAHSGVPTVPTVPHSVPNLAPVPGEDGAHRAIRAKQYGHGAASGLAHDSDDPEL